MQMNIMEAKERNVYKAWNPYKKDSKRDKYIHNKKRAGRAFKEKMRQELIKKYEGEWI